MLVADESTCLSLLSPNQGTTVRTMLSFINTKTRQKFVITGKQDTACEALGWKPDEVQEAGGMTEFMHSHEKLGVSLSQLLLK